MIQSASTKYEKNRVSARCLSRKIKYKIIVASETLKLLSKYNINKYTILCLYDE